MHFDAESPIILSEELVIVYLTIVARTVRRLEKEFGPGSSERFLEVLQRSLEVEMALSKPSATPRLQLSEIQKALVRLVETMPLAEDL